MSDPTSSAPEPAADVTVTIELVRRAQKDDDQLAFNRLFERYYERLHAIVRLRMGAHLKSLVEPEDVIQETFIAALRSFDRFEVLDDASFIRWLSTIAINQIRGQADYHFAKKRDRRRDRALEGIRTAMRSGELKIDPPSPLPSPAAELDVREQLEEIVEAVNDLNDAQREVFVLRHFVYDQHTPWDEIAAAMGGTRDANATRVLHSRAVTRLLTAMRQRRDDKRAEAKGD